MDKKVKALLLFSGGLDSMLAAKVLMEQNIEVTAVCFKSNFYNCEKARISAEHIGIPLKEIDITNEMISLVKNPPSGYGKNLNPCIDCHALMIRTAMRKIDLYKMGSDQGAVTRLSARQVSDQEIQSPQPPLSRGRNSITPLIKASTLSSAERGGRGDFDFITTGEVLGQRPFSQNREALERVMNLAGLEVLRPLSAKLLPETNVEKQGLVNRRRLLDISGRGRERQMELAKKYGISNYPSPAGGCLLTDPAFCERLLKMLEYWPECNNNDVELLKNGRIFWISLKDAKIRQLTPKNNLENQEMSDKALIVIGRNERENQELEKLARKGDIMLYLKEVNGPTTIIRMSNVECRMSNEILEIEIPNELQLSKLKLGEPKDVDETLEIAALLTGFYAVKARGKNVMIEIRDL